MGRYMGLGAGTLKAIETIETIPDHSQQERGVRDRLIQSLLSGLPALALMCASAHPGSGEPLTLRSEAGRFTLRLTGIERPERLNHLHGFACALTTADGRPAAGASIVVTGQHRYALNPLPTSPRVRPGPADGTYQVEGLRFHIAGEWGLALEIEFEQIHDRATLEVVVE
jgi:hypothetical protein